VNAEAPARAAEAAAELDIPLLHVSTDYVFDGTKNGEYATADPCTPVNAYGASKRDGELAVRRLAPKEMPTLARESRVTRRGNETRSRAFGTPRTWRCDPLRHQKCTARGILEGDGRFQPFDKLLLRRDSKQTRGG
jgi:hypothetical protein